MGDGRINRASWTLWFDPSTMPGGGGTQANHPRCVKQYVLQGKMKPFGCKCGCQGFGGCCSGALHSGGSGGYEHSLLDNPGLDYVLQGEAWVYGSALWTSWRSLLLAAVIATSRCGGARGSRGLSWLWILGLLVSGPPCGVT